MADTEAVTRVGFVQQMQRLLDGLAPGFPADRYAGWVAEMEDQFGALAAPTLRHAVTLALVQLEQVPSPARFRPFAEEARRRDERENEKALPPPPPPPDGKRMTGPERAAFLERHLALGKLRARYGAYDLNVPFLPPGGEAEVAGMIGQMRATGFMRGPLERIAAGEVVSPEDFIAGRRTNR